jgi:stage VI sporulation protein D
MTLTEQQNGLRFDIYERVHLSEGVAGIKELEGVELVPHIQVLPQGEQALLRGNLLLSGTYVDEQDAVNRTLEHLIPVEITLPMNRVHRVEDIAVEIENFDVDLLSARSLNITGVLSLNGLEAVSLPASGDAWSVDEEEVVFVHETGQSQPSAGAQDKSEWASPSLAFAAARPPVSTDSMEDDRKEDYRQHEASAGPSPGNPHDWTVEVGGIPIEREDFQVQTDERPNVLETLQHQLDENSEGSYTLDEKKEMKIAFAGKQPEEAKPSKSIGLTTLLQSASSVKADPRNPDTKASSTVQPTIGDRLEWKKLLLSPMSEQQEFRRVKLCIVQKEETLEIIAKRYELNPREIALFNRLSENEVSEGQIVYIPK